MDTYTYLYNNTYIYTHMYTHTQKKIKRCVYLKKVVLNREETNVFELLIRIKVHVKYDLTP